MLPRGVSVLLGGVLPRGCFRGGIPACTEANTPLPSVNGMTDACENFTLPQLRCGR